MQMTSFMSTSMAGGFPGVAAAGAAFSIERTRK